MKTDSNLYAIDQYLRTLDAQEEAEMRHVELTNAWQCGECGEMYYEHSDAVDCCNVETTVTVKEDVYMCIVCEQISEDIDDIKGHNHDS